jgi:hypothetical protein
MAMGGGGGGWAMAVSVRVMNMAMARSTMLAKETAADGAGASGAIGGGGSAATAGAQMGVESLSATLVRFCTKSIGCGGSSGGADGRTSALNWNAGSISISSLGGRLASSAACLSISYDVFRFL